MLRAHPRQWQYGQMDLSYFWPVALLLLVVVQWVLAALRSRWRFMRRFLDAPPVLLYYDGEVQLKALRRHRLTEVDVHTAARQSGHGSLADIQVVILHQDGSLGVIAQDSIGDGSSVLPFIQRYQADSGSTR